MRLALAVLVASAGRGLVLDRHASRTLRATPPGVVAADRPADNTVATAAAAAVDQPGIHSRQLR